MSIAIRFVIDRKDFKLDIDLELPSSGVTAIFGPSGCGKTTLLRAIAGFETASEGYLRVGDSVWQNGNFKLPTHQRPLGYVFQEASLFGHLDVRGNLEYGLKRIAPGSRKIQLELLTELLGIDTFLQRNPAELSGGEKQRVAIARALAVSPEILLMDEPLAALDLERKREILPYLESLTKELDIPVLYVSHEAGEVARLADYLVLLSQGREQGAGSTADMFSRLDLPLALSDRAASLIKAKVVGFDREFGLTLLEFGDSLLTISCKPIELDEIVKIRIFARDVSLTLEKQTGTSVQNILAATIIAMDQLNESQMMIRLALGEDFLLARITKKSASQLSLKTGQRVYAQIKSVALLT